MTAASVCPVGLLWTTSHKPYAICDGQHGALRAAVEALTAPDGPGMAPGATGPVLEAPRRPQTAVTGPTRPAATGEPQTEAGRTFLAALETMDRLDPCQPPPVDWRHGIRQVEAEAAAAERAETRAAWETAKRQFGSRRWLESGDCIAFVDGMLADPVP